MDYKENNIEFLKGQQRATASFTQGRFISRIEKLAEQYPEEVEIVAHNSDGSICAHFPTKWIKINPPQKLSEERREELSKRMTELAEKKRTENRF